MIDEKDFSCTEIMEKINQQKKFYELLLNYLSYENETDNIEEMDYLKEIFKYIDNVLNRDEIHIILKVKNSIADNHFRYDTFFNKIEQIILYCSTKIKQNFTNLEIFTIFKNNKLLLLFLFENKIIIQDESIFQFINSKTDKMNQYKFYFSPLNNNLCNEENIIEDDQNLYYQKRKIGENDNYICEMIRNDSINEFIQYVNKTNLSLSSQIKQSIYETNSFLINNKPTLIEYAAFFGSIQIFQYLKYSNVNMSPMLWLYAIHSNNPQMIHILEEYQVELPNYEKCLEESIKCHHNSIANYFIDNYIDNKQMQYNIDNNFKENIYAYCFKYYNYDFFPKNLTHKYVFGYLCEFSYLSLVKLYLKGGNIDLNAKIFRDYVKIIIHNILT